MSSFLSFTRILVTAILFAVMFDCRIKSEGHAQQTTVLSVIKQETKKEKRFSFDDDPVVVSDPPSFVVPFSRAGNLILLKAKADAVEGNFILDTGAPGLILNTTYFRNYPMTEGGTGEQSGGITGSVSQAAATNVKQLSFGSVNYYKLRADRINLGHIEDNKGVKIIGLLGMQLFKQFEMIIDYDKALIYFHLISRKEAKTYQHEMLNDTAAYSTFSITVSDNKILTYGKVGSKKLTFLVDTGAESNVIDSRLSENVLDHVSVTRRIKLNGAGNQKIDALYGDIRNLTVGSRDIATMPVLITNMEKMCFSYNRCLDGMLGFDFLSMHKIGFNFVKRKMYIWK